ncbi:MAG: hypothetical protein ACI9LE_000581 [Paraglaciecola sp.]|jgi:hypothetical protein
MIIDILEMVKRMLGINFTCFKFSTSKKLSDIAGSSAIDLPTIINVILGGICSSVVLVIELSQDF